MLVDWDLIRRGSPGIVFGFKDLVNRVEGQTDARRFAWFSKLARNFFSALCLVATPAYRLWPH
jgi:hypothetical protein